MIFLLLENLSQMNAGQNLNTLINICKKLGFPLAIDKIDGPTTLQIIFLRILLDSAKMEMRLPEQKLWDIENMVSLWLNKKVTSKRDLLSLIGHLTYASKVVPQGRPFVCRMIDLAATHKLLDHPIRLDQDFRSDLLWWHLFLDTWNGVSCLQSHIKSPRTSHSIPIHRGTGVVEP